LQRQRRRWTTALACYVLAGGILSLAGWVLDVPRVTDWFGNGISIQPNTCLTVVLASLSLLCLTAERRRAAAAPSRS
jgi:hypothetical protein